MLIIPPSKPLAPYVEAYYISTYPNPEWPLSVYPAISTCYVKVSSTTAVISGQATQPTDIGPASGKMTGLSVRLRVGCLYRLFGVPASELTDQVIQLNEFLGYAANEILEQVAEEENPFVWVKCFERYFMRIVQRKTYHDFSVEERAVDVLNKSPEIPVAELAAKYGYSPRHLHRRLSDYLGLSPRLYKCITRFERAFDLMPRSIHAGRFDWAAFALTCGYSDQAHFIREFRRFTGSTPMFLQKAR